MAFTIIEHIGRDQANAKERIRATVIAAFSISTLLTGVVFFGLGKFRLGELIGFFPRHILLGCVGGVGFFLVQTGLEVSARLPGSLQWDATTLHRIVEPGTLPLWTIPLVLALLLYVVKHLIRRQATDAIYFTSIIAVFWFFVLAIPALKVPVLRQKGWIFEEPEAGKPWYHFYTLYSAKHMDWSALERCIPAMLALTFFAVLHVPINIPALGMNLEEDTIDLDRELTAHGYSNFLSGLFGSVQNYLVFANTTLFIRSGGDDRVAGVMLAAATFIVMALGQTILGFIPVMVVGALIFFIGFELLKDGLVSPWGKTNRLEYLTVSNLPMLSTIVCSRLTSSDHHHRNHHGSLGFCMRYHRRHSSCLHQLCSADLAGFSNSWEALRWRCQLDCPETSSPTSFLRTSRTTNLCDEACRIPLLWHHCRRREAHPSNCR